MAVASRESLWTMGLLEDFHEKGSRPVVIYENNQSVIKLVKTGERRDNTKHINAKYHYVTDLFKQGVIGVKYCPSDEMIPNMMTKPLGAVKLRKHREACQLMEIQRDVA